MAKSKKENDKPERKKRKKKKKLIDANNMPFIAVTSLLGLSILIPVILLIVSVFMHKDTTNNLTRSLYPIKYESYVEKAAKEYNVDVCLVYGVIRNESNFNPDAVSGAGAIGLMQLMPDTFTWLQNYREDFEPKKLMDSDKLYDPKINIDYGTYLLRYLLDKYYGDKSLAICAYNAGYGNVDNWIADGTIPNGNVSPEDVPFTETSNYLSRVTESMEMYRELYFSKLESYPDGNIPDEVVYDEEGNDESPEADVYSEEEKLNEPLDGQEENNDYYIGEQDYDEYQYFEE